MQNIFQVRIHKILCFQSQLHNWPVSSSVARVAVESGVDDGGDMVGSWAVLGSNVGRWWVSLGVSLVSVGDGDLAPLGHQWLPLYIIY